MKVKCTNYHSVIIDYKKIYPWKIPINFLPGDDENIKEINLLINGTDNFNIKNQIQNIICFYSEKRWTAGLSTSSFDRFDLHIKINADNESIDYNGKERGEDGLLIRGICSRNLFFDNQIDITISPRACYEMINSHFDREFELKRVNENWEKWTPEGWIKHVLAHELAHFMCIPKLKKKYESLDDILAQIFACHYDVCENNQPLIHIPSGRYLKNHWNNYFTINSKNSISYNDELKNVFTTSDYWLKDLTFFKYLHEDP